MKDEVCTLVVSLTCCIAVGLLVALILVSVMKRRPCVTLSRRDGLFSATDIVILLTCTVHISNVSNIRQVDPAEREETYKASIRRWVTETPFRIVTVENSGFAMSPAWLGVASDRYEAISYDARTDPKARISTSKGIYEVDAINRALQQSVFLSAAPFFVKVTGRFFIPDLYDIFVASNLNFNAVRQSDANECQVIGCRTGFAAVLFHPDIEGHVESSYKKRLDTAEHGWTRNSVLVLPPMKIPPTRTGGYGHIIQVH